MTIKTEAKLLRRVLSAAIDYGLFFTFFLWLVVTYGVPNDEGGYTLKNDPKGWLIILFWLIYFPVTESFKGKTLGKLIAGLKVIAISGAPITFGKAVKRHLLDFFDLFFFGTIAFITIKNTQNHQRLGDLWAKTIVIGGESVICPNCKEKLSLTPNELLSQKYVCPSCQASNSL
ncbi:RDD family protein [Flammeovirgaceae bacterium SG7u.111]|nr:RDD family protein [Flammeovirgaceae bacterium SG7u.132]WPO34845.1 RDD family protein [Flammeovirgaceae bacterium SG7u.111]